MSPHFFHAEGVAAAATILTIGAGATAWLYKAICTLDVTTRIVRHMYHNDIPHLTRAVRRISAKLGVEFEDSPPPPLL